MISTIIVILIIVGVMASFYMIHKADEIQMKEYEREQRRIEKLRMDWYKKGYKVRPESSNFVEADCYKN